MLVLFDVSCLAFLFALVLTPWVRNAANRLGLVDKPDAARKMHLVSVPRVGGVGVALAYALALVFVAFAPYRNLSVDVPGSIDAALKLAPAAIVILLIGLADDIRGLRPWHKLLGEVVAAILAYQAGFGVSVFRGQPVGEWVSPVLTVLWLVGCCNALNLIDGIDGLAAGVGIFATLTAFVAALVHNSLELALVTAPLIGALLGFLRYNFNPASIFLGDSGSLLIGFLLGCFGAMWSQKSATLLGMTAPLIALAMPLLDTALAIARRFLRRQPIFGADRGHIHHRLLDRGLTPRRVALLLYGACGLAAAFSLIQDVGHDQFGGLIIILFCGAAWVGVQHLGYAEFGVASRLVLRGSFRSMVNAQLRLQQFERNLATAVGLDDAWTLISAGAEEFGWTGVRLQLCGRIWDSTPNVESAAYWQVRVPLPEGQYLNLSSDPAVDIHPVLLASFPKLLEKFLVSRYAATPEIPATAPAATGVEA
uniref:Glycosyl transferase, family 4 n=1 Tax=Solibacter usitatus (strain Ellin6076) TaxID=234267 RepID=Q01XJ8_SOLUE